MIYPDDARQMLHALLADNLTVPVDPTPYPTGNGYPRVVVGVETREYEPGAVDPATVTYTVTVIGSENTATGFARTETLTEQVLGLLHNDPNTFVTTTLTVTVPAAEDGQTLPGTEITTEVIP